MKHLSTYSPKKNFTACSLCGYTREYHIIIGEDALCPYAKNLEKVLDENKRLAADLQSQVHQTSKYQSDLRTAALQSLGLLNLLIAALSPVDKEKDLADLKALKTKVRKIKVRRKIKKI